MNIDDLTIKSIEVLTNHRNTVKAGGDGVEITEILAKVNWLFLNEYIHNFKENSDQYTGMLNTIDKTPDVWLNALETMRYGLWAHGFHNDIPYADQPDIDWEIACFGLELFGKYFQYLI